MGQGLVIAGFVLGTIYGWIVQSLEWAVYGWLAGLALAMILCVPPWPWYRRHPIEWLPSKEEEVENSSDESSNEQDE